MSKAVNQRAIMETAERQMLSVGCKSLYIYPEAVLTIMNLFGFDDLEYAKGLINPCVS